MLQARLPKFLGRIVFINKEASSGIDGNEASYYEVRVKNELKKDWSCWFEDMTITHLESGVSLIRGKIRDQSALNGLLCKLWSLGLKIISVTELSETDKENNGHDRWQPTE